MNSSLSIAEEVMRRGKFTTKHIQLVPKYKVLSLQRCPRSEQPDESGPDQFAETIHQP
jgi:hypothetical protein